MRDQTPLHCRGLYAARNALSTTTPTNVARSPRRKQASRGFYVL